MNAQLEQLEQLVDDFPVDALSGIEGVDYRIEGDQWLTKKGRPMLPISRKKYKIESVRL